MDTIGGFFFFTCAMPITITKVIWHCICLYQLGDDACCACCSQAPGAVLTGRCTLVNGGQLIPSGQEEPRHFVLTDRPTLIEGVTWSGNTQDVG